MARDPDQEATRIAARQLGLITHRQARHRAGLSAKQIRTRVASGLWRCVQRGVYAIDGSTPTWQRSALAAQRQARTERLAVVRGKQRLEEIDDAVLTGRSALWLREVRRLGKPEHHELLVCRARAPLVAGAEVALTRCLPAGDVEVVNAVPTLAVPRLAVELSRILEDTAFVAALDDLLAGVDDRTRRCVHHRARVLSRGRPECKRVVELTCPDAAEHFNSWLERHVDAVLDSADLVPHCWNLEIRDAAGDLIGIGDAVWLAQRVVVELDGLRFHTTPAQLRADRRKDRRLAMNGWLVLRYTWLDVVERPHEVVSEIAAALAGRS